MLGRYAYSPDVLLDRAFAKPVYAKTWPSSRCPSCGHGSLVAKEDSIVTKQTAESRRLQSHEAWEPDWITGSFSLPIDCGRSSCGERVFATGEYRIEPDANHGRWDGHSYTDALHVRHFWPILPLIECPTDVSEVVRNNIARASNAIWSDPASAANCLRVAIEGLLDDLGVAASRSLGERIKWYRPSNADVADLLLSVKWVGNDGSHLSGVDVDAALDAAEILEHALELQYENKADRLKRRSKQINQSKSSRP